MEIWKKIWVGVFFLNTVYIYTQNAHQNNTALRQSQPSAHDRLMFHTARLVNLYINTLNKLKQIRLKCGEISVSVFRKCLQLVFGINKKSSTKISSKTKQYQHEFDKFSDSTTGSNHSSFFTGTSSHMPYPFDAHCCHMGTAIKHPVPDRHLWFLTSGHSDSQVWASECPDVKNCKWQLKPPKG